MDADDPRHGTVPGLTCCRCHGALYPNTATRTDEGWRHRQRCARTCSVDGCDGKHLARGWCARHYRQNTGHATGTMPSREEIDNRLEDLRWMAETGESLSGAAARIGLSVESCRTFLKRHDPAVLTELTKRQPIDPNSATAARVLARWSAA